MTIAELIYEPVKSLPENAAREVLDFAGYLRERGTPAEARFHGCAVVIAKLGLG